MDPQLLSLWQQKIKASGYSITRQRELVFSLLVNREPQSLHELFARSNKQIDRASLYRTIKLFESLGIIQKVYDGWKYRLELTDIFSNHHHHITCLGCALTIPIEKDSGIERDIVKLAAKYRITPIKHQLEIQGYCQNCSKAKLAN